MSLGTPKSYFPRQGLKYGFESTTEIFSPLLALWLKIEKTKQYAVMNDREKNS